MSDMSTNLIPFPGKIPQWTFADRLRKVRRDLGFTIEQMAVALEIGDKRYGAWESGRNRPSDLAEVAVQLEQLSGVPRTWFLGWADESPRPDGPDGGNVHPLGLEPRTHWIRDNVQHVEFGAVAA